MPRPPNSLGPGIERRGHRLYVFLRVPEDVRGAIGRSIYRKALDTDSVTIARQRAPILLAAWHREIAKARKEPLGSDVDFWKEALATHSGPGVLEAFQDAVEDLADALHGDPMTDHSEEAVAEAKRFQGLAEGTIVPTGAHVDAWLATVAVKPKTLHMMKASIDKLTERHPYLTEITRKAMQQIIYDMQAEGLTPPTLRRFVGTVRSYWGYLQVNEIVDENLEPCDKLKIPKATAAQQAASKRQVFTLEQVRELRAACEGDRDLLALTAIAAYTGMRLGEICHLTIDRVDLKKGSIEITDAKTKAGWRQVPIHSAIRPTLVTLVGNRAAGYLLEYLTADQYGTRTGAVGSRFSRLKASLGYDKRLGFHCYRHTVATMLEQAGVAVGIAADIFGHEKPNMSYGTYSGGSSLEQKKAAIEKLVYPNK